MYDAQGVLLYVGKAKILRSRVRSYFREKHSSPRIALMIKQIHHIETTETQSEQEALILEHILIKQLKPKYNIIFRDDKSYPYLRLSDHPYPMISVYRGKRKKNDGYFGPYPNREMVDATLVLLQQAFLLRTCQDSVFSNRSRPCLLYQIKRCSAPCVGLISQQAYAEDVRKAMDVLQGKRDDVVREAEWAMQKASEELDFEEAALWRDRIACLRKMQMSQDIEHSDPDLSCDMLVLYQQDGLNCVQWIVIREGQWQGDRSILIDDDLGMSAQELSTRFIMQYYEHIGCPDVLVVDPPPDSVLEESLSKLYNKKIKLYRRLKSGMRVWVDLAKKNAATAIERHKKKTHTQHVRVQALEEFLGQTNIRRMECFDISHTQGIDTVASCVVYEDGAMQPKYYLRYVLKGEHGGDDYGAMQEAVSRRLAQQSEHSLPDVLLIDGGVGQLHAVQRTLYEWVSRGGAMPTHMVLVGVAKGPERLAGREDFDCVA